MADGDKLSIKCCAILLKRFVNWKRYYFLNKHRDFTSRRLQYQKTVSTIVLPINWPTCAKRLTMHVFISKLAQISQISRRFRLRIKSVMIVFKYYCWLFISVLQRRSQQTHCTQCRRLYWCETFKNLCCSVSASVIACFVWKKIKFVRMLK